MSGMNKRLLTFLAMGAALLLSPPLEASFGPGGMFPTPQVAAMDPYLAGGIWPGAVPGGAFMPPVDPTLGLQPYFAPDPMTQGYMQASFISNNFHKPGSSWMQVGNNQPVAFPAVGWARIMNSANYDRFLNSMSPFAY